MIYPKFHLYAPETANPAQTPLPYVKSAGKRFIITFVAILHGGIVLLPLLFILLEDTFKKPPRYVMRVPVVDSVPKESSSPGPAAAASRSQNTDLPGPPKQLDDLPEIVELLPEPTPKPEPAPKQQIQQKNPPKVVKQKIITQGKKPVTLPRPKQKVTQKTVRRPAVKISTKRVKRPLVNRNTAQARAREQQALRRQAAARARAQARRNADLARALRNLGRTGGGSGRATSSGGRQNSAATATQIEHYYDLIQKYLKNRWNQPGGVTADDLQVVIRFKVDKTGRILAAYIEKRSGNNAMDYSVSQLIRSLNNVLPAPPSSMEFTVTMEIDR